MFKVGMIISKVAKIFGTSKAEVRSVQGECSNSEMITQALYRRLSLTAGSSEFNASLTGKHQAGLVGITAMILLASLTEISWDCPR